MLKGIQHINKRIKDGRLTELISQWKWLGAYILHYRGLIFLYTVLGASGSLLGLGTSVISRNLVDSLTGQSDGSIAIAAGIFAGVGISQLFISAIRQRMSLKTRVKITNEIRTDIFTQILQTDWEALSNFRSGDLLYRINGDTGMISNNILTFIPSLVTVLISFGGAFIVMIRTDPTMALIALAGAPISLIASQYSAKKMREHQKEQQDFAGNTLANNQEVFQNLQMIKAFGLTDYFSEQFRKMQDESLKISLRHDKFQVKMMIMTGLIGQLVGYACYGFAAYRLYKGDITYGTMTMLVSMAASLRGAFSSVTGLLPTAIRTAISAGRIMEITCLPRERKIDKAAAKKLKHDAQESGMAVRLRDVIFSYGTNKPIYKNVNFDAEPGEIIGLIGPSGQGKTTTLRIFLGLFHIKGGNAFVENPRGEQTPVSSATRCLFSYIPQVNILFSGTIADNMRMLKPDATEQEIIEVLKTACIWDFISELKDGINTAVRDCGHGFSEGQKQRLSIARALLADAPIILLDEATSALDMATERKVLKNIMKNDPHRTIIVTAHRPGVFSMCNRVYKVQNGTMKQISRTEIDEFISND